MYIIICIVLVIYFLPSIIGLIKRHSDLSQIAIINLLLGWSVLFWVVSFRHAVGWDAIGANNNFGKK